MDEHVTVDRHTLYAIGWGLIELPTWPKEDATGHTTGVRDTAMKRRAMVSRCVSYASSRGWTLKFSHGSSLEPVYRLGSSDELYKPFTGTLQACCRRIMEWEQNPTP